MQFEISSMSFAAGEDVSDYSSVFQKWMGNGGLFFCPDLSLPVFFKTLNKLHSFPIENQNEKYKC